MQFKVGDKVEAIVHGEKITGIIKEVNAGIFHKENLIYFNNWHEGHNGNDCCKRKYEGYNCWYLRDEELVLIERDGNSMKKSDLKNGAIVETREGSKYILLLDAIGFGKVKSMFIELETGNYLDFDDYENDLTYHNERYSEFDIMKVCQNDYVGDNIKLHILKRSQICGAKHWTWERQEKVVMTISEIEEKLGIKGLKIKKED